MNPVSSSHDRASDRSGLLATLVVTSAPSPQRTAARHTFKQQKKVRRPLKTVLAVHADGSKVYLSEHPQQNHRKLQLFHDINAAEAAYAESLIKERAENRCLQGGCSDHCQSNWQRFLKMWMKSCGWVLTRWTKTRIDIHSSVTETKSDDE
ncbi:unnamed protein product [Cladocopium goreaui]|uniref:Uncharacterized protein n=1 Tax=Cladocopium goreaui TaxID=2562237 RepID=A0A9P1BVS9_9DINO|nr:unnamed protein product [Cladocopium goreaui]